MITASSVIMKKVNGNSLDFFELIQKAKNEFNLSDEEIVKLKSVKSMLKDTSNRNFGKKMMLISLLFLLFGALPVTVLWSIYQANTYGKYFALLINYQIHGDTGLNETDCLIVPPDFAGDYFRPPLDCSECANVKDVISVTNLSPDDFVEKYGFSMQPILIEDGQENWTASQTFDYDFLKEVYSDPKALDKVKQNCQFFPYKTKMDSLKEFFNMSRDRVEGKEAPWYVGWSNCDGKTANRLREHYKTPYFLPPYLDRSNIDWIFMGLPGYGAPMHIDSVDTLSWQAQIKGTKRWILQTPPECYGQCIERIEIIVKPGQIIVLDTNKWFHSTEIIGNETSIVIGSEYF